MKICKLFVMMAIDRDLSPKNRFTHSIIVKLINKLMEVEGVHKSVSFCLDAPVLYNAQSRQGKMCECHDVVHFICLKTYSFFKCISFKHMQMSWGLCTYAFFSCLRWDNWSRVEVYLMPEFVFMKFMLKISWSDCLCFVIANWCNFYIPLTKTFNAVFTFQILSLNRETR